MIYIYLWHFQNYYIYIYFYSCEGAFNGVLCTLADIVLDIQCVPEPAGQVAPSLAFTEAEEAVTVKCVATYCESSSLHSVQPKWSLVFFKSCRL